MWRSIKEIFKLRPWLLIGLQCLILIQMTSEMAIPIMLRFLFTSAGHESPATQIAFVAGIMLGLSLVAFAAGLSAWLLSNRIATEFGFILRNRLFKKIQSLTVFDLNKFSNASLVNRMNNNMKEVVDWISFIIRIISRSCLLLVGGFIATVVILYSVPTANSYLIGVDQRYIIIVVVLIMIIIGFIFIFFIVNNSRKSFELTQPKVEEINSAVRENVLGVRFIKAFNMQKEQQNRFNSKVISLENALIKLGKFEGLTGPVIIFLMNLVILITIWVGVNLEIVEIAQITSLVQTLSLMMLGLMISIFILSYLGRANVSAKRIYEVIDYESQLKYPQNSVNVKNYDIQFDNINVRYFANSSPVLQKINLKIPQGSSLGIIGKAGSGKSTFVNLIARLFDPTEGKITIGNEKLQDFSRQKLKELISFVPQENFLFAGTITKNLKMANENATLEEMWKGCELACAKAFLEEHELKLEQPVDQRGNNFSGGQKQRLCIARALIKKAPILIMDDSTSALDTKTEQKVLNNINHLEHKPTKIIISQKISTVINLEKIMVLDNGEIVGYDNHDNLMQTCPIYKEIATSQLGIGE